MALNLGAKKFKNKYCQACIEKNFKKYGKFNCRCDGITVDQDVNYAIANGMPEEEARYLFDPTFFFKIRYGNNPRDYQEAPLLCTSRSLAARQCRQSGKSLAFMFKILHFVLTNSNKSVLIVCPQETQIKKLWDEYIFRDCIDKHPDLLKSVVSRSQKPNYVVKFDNGSKIILMIAGPGVRSQTADWIYIDEAAMIPTETLNDILMTIASKGLEAQVLMTSTPKGRANIFYQACQEDSEFNEYHVSIHQIPDMIPLIPKFKKMLGESGFVQECEAGFPDSAGGPFNLRGISLARHPYVYGDFTRTNDAIYIGGVDWNGPNVGTYFYVIAFNPGTLEVVVVDKKVVSSAQWNSTVAKETLKELNRKWQPAHWMCDYGYGHSLIEEIKVWSMQQEHLPPNHPDVKLKHIIDAVNFGEWLSVEDPFTGEETKKTTKSFIVGQVSRLFEPTPANIVKVSFSDEDEELKKCLEAYKLLQITDKGTEKYGFDKKDQIEDHAIDAFILACYGITKYYNELFRRMIFESAILDAREILKPMNDMGDQKVIYAGSIVLLTDNHPESIMLDERDIKDPTEGKDPLIISRGFSKDMIKRKHNVGSLSSIMKSRGGLIRRV